jgi:methylenetetrahydrofolate reductase (NADPH)
MLNRLDKILEVQPPLDWSRVGRETWGKVFSEVRHRGLLSPTNLSRKEFWRDQLQDIFKDIRQPDWWQGDAYYHPSSHEKPVSKLQASLEQGEFVITAEISPPTGANADQVRKKAASFLGVLHAANVTQNPMATARMSSLAFCQKLNEYGIEPVLQLTARDYNRLVLQSEVLGAAAMGIYNVLCLTGDTPTTGRGPAGNLPFDLDATQLLWILRRMRDNHRFLDGRTIKEPPKIFLGAAGSPNDPNPKHEALRLEKKINAGAQFIQTQLVYDSLQLERWLEALEDRDLLSKAHILVGIGPLRSTKIARFLQQRIPDISMPGSIIEQLESSSHTEDTGIEIALNLIEKIRKLPGVGGIHIMSLGWESALPRLVNAVG